METKIQTPIDDAQTIQMQPDVIFIETQLGTYVRNSKGSFTIKGKGTYAICSWLRKKLNGDLSLKDIMNSAPTQAVSVIKKIVTALSDHHCIIPVLREPKLNSYMYTSLFFQGIKTFIHNIEFVLKEYGLQHFQLQETEITGNIVAILMTEDFSGSIIDTADSLIIAEDRNIQSLSLLNIADHQNNVPITQPCLLLAANQLVRLWIDRKRHNKKDNVIWHIDKQNLKITHYRPNPFYSHTLNSIFLPENIPDLNLRMDIPSAAANSILLTELENINRTIPYLVDQLTGPIIEIKEGNVKQLPLSAVACKHLVYKDNKVVAEEIIGYAISAREARNQVVLYAMERFYQSQSSDTCYYGVGWSEFEAIYRAFCQYAKKHYPIDLLARDEKWNLADRLDQKAQTIALFLQESYQDQEKTIPEIYWRKIQDGFYLAYCVNAPELAVGLTLEHAILNLYQQLLVKLIPGNQSYNAIYCALLWACTKQTDFIQMLEFIQSNVELDQIKLQQSVSKSVTKNIFIYRIQKRGK